MDTSCEPPANPKEQPDESAYQRQWHHWHHQRKDQQQARHRYREERNEDDSEPCAKAARLGRQVCGGRC